VEEYFWLNMWISEAWIQMARSQQIDFGWDWSMALAPQGIFGDVVLVSKQVEILEPLINSEIHDLSGVPRSKARVAIKALLKHPSHL